jgi:hypothetical protein
MSEYWEAEDLTPEERLLRMIFGRPFTASERARANELNWRRMLGNLAGLDEPYRGNLGPKWKRHKAMETLLRYADETEPIPK